MADSVNFALFYSCINSEGMERGHHLRYFDETDFARFEIQVTGLVSEAKYEISKLWFIEPAEVLQPFNQVQNGIHLLLGSAEGEEK